MSVAQVKAARRKFREYYKKGVIGRPYYKRKSADKMDRLEAMRRERTKMMNDRKRKK